MTPVQKRRIGATFYLAWPFVPVAASFYMVTHHGLRDASAERKTTTPPPAVAPADPASGRPDAPREPTSSAR